MNDVAADRLDALARRIEAEVFAQIIEARGSGRQHATVTELLDVKVGLHPRRGITEDLLDKVLQANHSLHAAEFVENHGQRLAVLEEAGEQRTGLHGFRYEGRREQNLGEMHAIGQTAQGARVEETDHLVGRLTDDRRTEKFLFQENGPHLLVGHFVLDEHDVHPRRHVVAHRDPAEPEHFGQRFRFGQGEPAFLLPHPDERLDLFRSELGPRLERPWEKFSRHGCDQRLDAVEERTEDPPHNRTRAQERTLPSTRTAPGHDRGEHFEQDGRGEEPQNPRPHRSTQRARRPHRREPQRAPTASPRQGTAESEKSEKTIARMGKVGRLQGQARRPRPLIHALARGVPEHGFQRTQSSAERGE